MPVTVFPRQPNHSPPPVFFTGPKVFSAVGHALIGVWIYLLLKENAGGKFVESVGRLLFGQEEEVKTTAVEGDRVVYFVAFSTIYGLRWALGAFTTNAGGPMPWFASIQVVILHTLLMYVLPMTVFSTIGDGGVPSNLNGWDYFAFGLSILAGILQQGSELQRLIFKCNPANKGKLHKTGLFGYARYVNHTGHVLQDVALAIAARSKFVAIMSLMAIPLLVFQITPETEEHMKRKYKEKYEQYVKETPYKFIPYVW